MNNLIFKITNYNWGLICLGDWKNIEYKIYNDGTVKIEKNYNSMN